MSKVGCDFDAHLLLAVYGQEVLINRGEARRSRPARASRLHV